MQKQLRNSDKIHTFAGVKQIIIIHWTWERTRRTSSVMTEQLCFEIAGRIQALIDNNQIEGIGCQVYEIIPCTWRVVVFRTTEQDYFTNREIKWLNACAVLNDRNWFIQPTEDGSSVEMVID